MGRKAKRPHELIPTEHKGEARVCYLGVYYSLGPWDRENNRPSPEAAEKLERLRALWAAGGGVKVPAKTPLMMAAWSEWRASPESPPEHSRDYQLVGDSLFGDGGDASSAPYLTTRTADFSAADLMAYRAVLVARKLSRWTISRRVAIVLQFFRWAVVKGFAAADTLFAMSNLPPVQGVKEKDDRGIATAEEVGRVADRLSSRAGDLLRLLALTGARPSELCGLTVGSIQTGGVWRSRKGLAVDLDAAGVWCAEIAGGGKMRRKGIQRVLFFGPKAKALLADRVDGRYPSLPLFVTAEGNRYTSKLLQRYVKLACDRRGAERITPYMIRHGVAARVQQEFGAATPGLGFLAAQAVLGHAIKGATQGYAGVDYQCAARVMAAVG